MSLTESTAVAVDQLISRFAAEQLMRAVSCLAAGPADAASIHETRKSIKRIRAALKLVQSDLGPRFDDWNDRLRSANRRLSATRDLDACQQTIEKLAGRHATQGQAVLGRLHSELAAQRSRSVNGEVDAERKSLVEELEAVRAEFLEWHPETTGFDLIRPAVKKMVRKGRKLIRQLGQDVIIERMHALRKVVKRRLYWMEILAPIWSEEDREEQQAVDKLSELLGQQHDLAVLEERLANSAVGRDSAASRAVASVGDALRRRREKLEARCLKRAKKLFAERPKELTRRWEAVAEAWQAAATAPFATTAVAADKPALPARAS